jgi:hypothetical protein
MVTTHQPWIYFHVGLGKVASTYLQYQFFPKLQGIRYIQRTQYRKAPDLIQQEQAPKYLVSREFDRQLPEEVKWFGQYFQHVKPILLLRRHDAWIASQYRRYLKNGGRASLEGFLDLEHDQGRWRLAEVRFMPYIQALEQQFSFKPLVLFHEDFKADPQAFFQRLAGEMGVTYDLDRIDLQPSHTSYTDKQLRFMRKYGSYLFRSGRILPQQPLARWLKRRSEMLLSYTLLYSSQLLPEAWVQDEELYPAEYLRAIRQYFQEDWEACRAYARQQAIQ